MTQPDVREPDQWSDLEGRIQRGQDAWEHQDLVSFSSLARVILDYDLSPLIAEVRRLKAIVRTHEWQASFQSLYEEAEMKRKEAEARAERFDTAIRRMLILWDEECAGRYVQDPAPVAALRSSVEKA